jgi:benzylsuccinate CoA-transferase BbsF subunit
MKDALKGLRVLDFCWVGAGALVTQALALHGAEIIKVESRSRPDNLRLSPPVRPGTEGLDASGYFASRNSNKKSFALNMSDPRALPIARQLAAASSVVTSNFRPGVMERWGLGYDDLVREQPGLVYLTMPMQGDSGPRRNYSGFGSTISALAGLVEPSGLPNRAPVGTGTHYPDHVPNPGHALVALLAVLFDRMRTGKGGRIELSQFESTVNLVGPALIRYSATGELPIRSGNQIENVSPHGVYPCEGNDAWIAIATRTQADWERLTSVLDLNGVADDPRFREISDRKQNEGALDSILSQATARYDRWVLMAKLQESGVAAGVVESVADIFQDPVLEARRYWRTLDHPVMGPIRLASTPHLWDGAAVQPTSPAPLLGQHTQKVASDLLGISADEYSTLVAEKVFW